MHIRGFILVLLNCLLVAACSSNKPVKTYEGAMLPDTEQVVMTAGENITVVSVNDKPVTKYLLSNIEVDYALRPGANKVVFQYRSVWAVSLRKDEDDPRAEEVTSAEQVVEFVAEPGSRLSFDYPEASDVREAKRLAKGFEARLINQAGTLLATSSEYSVVSKPVVASVSSPSVASSAAPIGTADAASSSNNTSQAVASQSPAPAAQPKLPTIDALKVLWDSASSEEKKAFLKWAFQ